MREEVTGIIKIAGVIYERPDLTTEMIGELKKANGITKPHLCRTCSVKNCAAYLDLSEERIVEGLSAPCEVYITKCNCYVRVIKKAKKPLTESELIEKYFDSSQVHIVHPTVSHSVRKLQI